MFTETYLASRLPFSRLTGFNANYSLAKCGTNIQQKYQSAKHFNNILRIESFISEPLYKYNKVWIT